MAQILVLRNHVGEVMRVFPWNSVETLWAVFRKDTRRIEIVSSLKPLENQNISYQVLKTISSSALQGRHIDIQGRGYLELSDSDQVSPRVRPPAKQEKSWYGRALLLALLLGGMGRIALLNFAPAPSEIVEEMRPEKKRELVKIVKKKIALPKTAMPRTTVSVQPLAPKKVVQKTAKKVGWKRRGALAALGQLSKSKQKGGLNLAAMETTAGPGMGGRAGSGGVQTNIYAKGLVAAPLGAGNNIRGGGGYGTKGKGGGKAGFGSVSLIGVTGASLIPIPSEASVEGGLSSETIADVVRRNLGQVRFCYEKGLQLQPGLAGRVNVAWTIDASGGVKIANVKNTSLKNRTVEDCILQRLKTWKFPLPQNKAEVKVSYPFLLKRVGSS